jgi:hypothetical protein
VPVLRTYVQNRREFHDLTGLLIYFLPRGGCGYFPLAPRQAASESRWGSARSVVGLFGGEVYVEQGHVGG